MTRGNTDVVDALHVGAEIEESDILDLIKQLEEVVDHEDIKMVYTNLLIGSRNHLRAFVRNLEKEGVTYQARYLEPGVYDDIISDQHENGHGPGRAPN